MRHVSMTVTLWLPAFLGPLDGLHAARLDDDQVVVLRAVRLDDGHALADGRFPGLLDGIHAARLDDGHAGDPHAACLDDGRPPKRGRVNPGCFRTSTLAPSQLSGHALADGRLLDCWTASLRHVSKTVMRASLM